MAVAPVASLAVAVVVMEGVVVVGAVVAVAAVVLAVAVAPVVVVVPVAVAVVVVAAVVPRGGEWRRVALVGGRRSARREGVAGGAVRAGRERAPTVIHSPSGTVPSALASSSSVTGSGSEWSSSSVAASGSEWSSSVGKLLLSEPQ